MNKRVAILATNGFEESELKSPLEAMKNEGFTVDIVSQESGKIKAWDNGNWSNEYTVDKTLDNVSASDYNALMLPGGVINPMALTNKWNNNRDANEESLWKGIEGEINGYGNLSEKESGLSCNDVYQLLKNRSQISEGHEKQDAHNVEESRDRYKNLNSQRKKESVNIFGREKLLDM